MLLPYRGDHMTKPIVHIIDDDEGVRQSLTFLLESAGFMTRSYDSAASFLSCLPGVNQGVVLTDVRMPNMTGLDLLGRLKEEACSLPVVVMTGHGDIPMAVEAMKAGVMDFLEKPFDDDALLRSINAALAARVTSADPPEAKRVKGLLDQLSTREREVLDGIIEGKLNKVIAFELGISPRTVEIYRANVMSKTGAKSLAELVRMVLMARR